MSNTYCVPFALAFVTGKTPDEVAALLQGQRMAAGHKKRAVSAVYGFEYGNLLHALGVKILADVRKPGMTLRKWAAIRVKWGDTKPWLVRISGHMVVYQDGKFYDNGCHGGAPLDAFTWSTSRLVRAWQVTA